MKFMDYEEGNISLESKGSYGCQSETITMLGYQWDIFSRKKEGCTLKVAEPWKVRGRLWVWQVLEGLIWFLKLCWMCN